MSYSRIPLTCQDFQLGFRTINQGIENNNLMWAQLIAKHLTAARNYPGDSLIGHHNDYFVPRSVGCWFPQQNIDSSWFAAGTSPYVGPCFGLPVRRDVGRWRIQLYEPSGAIVTACVVLGGTIGSAVGRKADASIYTPSGGNGITYVDVTTWDITSGLNPAPAYMPFSVVQWARR